MTKISNEESKDSSSYTVLVEGIKTGKELIINSTNAVVKTEVGKKAVENIGSIAANLTSPVKDITETGSLLFDTLFGTTNKLFEKILNYRNNFLDSDIKSAISSIPVDNRIEPKFSTVMDIAENVCKYHENENLKAMFLKLLNTSMDSRVADHFHPSFIHIIKSLDNQEAFILKELCKCLYNSIVFMPTQYPLFIIRQQKTQIFII